MLHICPETDRGRKVFPHAFVFPYTFLTLIDERLQSVFFDLVFSIQPQGAFYFQLYRQAMGIPSGFSWNLIAFHRTVSGDHVLDDTGQDMTDMRLSICGRRAVIEHVYLIAFPFFHTFFKNMIVFPEFFNFFFSVHKVQICGYFLIHKQPP